MEHILQDDYLFTLKSKAKSAEKANRPAADPSNEAVNWYKNTNSFYRFIYKHFIDSHITSKVLVACCHELADEIANLDDYIQKFKEECQKVVESAFNQENIANHASVTIAQRLKTKQLLAELNIQRAVADIYNKLNDNHYFASKDEQESLRYIKRDIKLRLNVKIRNMRREIHALRKMFNALAISNISLGSHSAIAQNHEDEEKLETKSGRVSAKAGLNEAFDELSASIKRKTPAIDEDENHLAEFKLVRML